MIFLYIAASVCMALCAAEIVLGIYALRAFRKWRGSVLRRFSELEAMIAAVPNVLREQQEDAEAEEKGKKRDLIDEFFGVFNYGLADAMRAAKAENGAEGDDE